MTDKTQLDAKLVQACSESNPNLDHILALIEAGADPNQTDKYDNSIFLHFFRDVLSDCRATPELMPATAEKIKTIILTMVSKGWDTKKFGMAIMHSFIFSTYDRFTFEMYRFMLQFDLTDDPKAYEDELDSIGTEESYQRCCENWHAGENLFYAIYEMVDAKRNGLNYQSILPYYDAVGLTVDKIVYFNQTDTTVKKKNFTEYNADFGFVCGDKLLVLCEGVNILFMNDRVCEQPQLDMSDRFGADVTGSKIINVDFEHKEICRGTTHYGQPTIIIELSGGKKLKFSHNFGELPDNKSQSRFWIGL